MKKNLETKLKLSLQIQNNNITIINDKILNRNRIYTTLR